MVKALWCRLQQRGRERICKLNRLKNDCVRDLTNQISCKFGLLFVRFSFVSCVFVRFVRFSFVSCVFVQFRAFLSLISVSH